VRSKIRLNFRRGGKTKKSEIKKWDTGEVNKKEIKKKLFVEECQIILKDKKTSLQHND
jgi:hypothetical protein